MRWHRVRALKMLDLSDESPELSEGHDLRAIQATHGAAGHAHVYDKLAMIDRRQPLLELRKYPFDRGDTAARAQDAPGGRYQQHDGQADREHRTDQIGVASHACPSSRTSTAAARIVPATV